MNQNQIVVYSQMAHKKMSPIPTASKHWEKNKGWANVGTGIVTPTSDEYLGCDERHGFGVVEAQAARQALLRQETSLVQAQLVHLARCQLHARLIASLSW